MTMMMMMIMIIRIKKIIMASKGANRFFTIS